ncbi:MAG: hypothetical protein JST22_03260 [Bacteroidetes bacterium]|nr:hypothetical protein [Bacteroidota bacterium]
MNVRHAVGYVGCLAVAAFAACGDGATQTADPPPQPTSAGRALAISAWPRSDSGVSAANILAAGDTADAAGARSRFLSHTWHELETSRGSFHLDGLTGDLRTLTADRDRTIMIGIQPINTTTKELPEDLRSLSFSDVKLRARFRTLIDSLAKYCTERVAYLSIGNEVDVYLDAHPAEWDAYQTFYEEMVNYVHAEMPWMKVGVTATFNGAAHGASAAMARLNQRSDVWMLTYYPLNADYTPHPPETVFGDVNSMVALSGAKPLVLQEVGYPSSPLLGSSEAVQTVFVRNIFSAWYTNRARIPFMNYFMLHDFPPSLIDSLAAYYGLPADTNFKAYLSSLGLRTADGRGKVAWGAFVDEAGKVH